MLKDTKMRFFTTIVSFILMTNTLFGSDTILWYPVKSVNQLRKATIILPYKTESELSKNKLVQFEGNLGQQLDDHFHPIINNNSASLEIDNYFCTSVTLLFSKVLISSQSDLNGQLTCLQIPNSKEDLSNIELAVPPPGDCPLLEALAKDLADPDKGPALNAYLDELLTEGSVRVKAWVGLIKTGLRTDVNWLTTVSKWLDEGVTVIDDVLPVRFMQNGQEIARIVDDKLIPTRFQIDGTVINEVKLPNQAFGKDVVKAADGKIGFKYQFQKTKIYRAMSNAEWLAVQSNNGLSIGNGTENFVSTSRAYSEGWIGKPGYDVLVEFTVQPKTIQDLAKIGVKNDAELIFKSGFEDLIPVTSGWSSTKAFFKGEGTAVNIGLGAQSVNTFNSNITTFVRLN
jgi:hypothetical protein